MPIHSLPVHSPSLLPSLSLALYFAISLPHSSSVSLPYPVSLTLFDQSSLLSLNPHHTRHHWLQGHCSPLISFLILDNIRLCFTWDFDYFVETYLKVVNLLFKMRILLSFICCNDDDLKYFLLYGYVCVIFSLMRILLSFTC